MLLFTEVLWWGCELTACRFSTIFNFSDHSGREALYSSTNSTSFICIISSNCSSVCVADSAVRYCSACVLFNFLSFSDYLMFEKLCALLFSQKWIENNLNEIYIYLRRGGQDLSKIVSIMIMRHFWHILAESISFALCCTCHTIWWIPIWEENYYRQICKQNVFRCNSCLYFGQ